MIEVVDMLKTRFDDIEIVNFDKNGKVNSKARWLFRKDRPRYRNVFMEIWEKDGWFKIVIRRNLLTPEEEATADRHAKKTSGNRTTWPVYPKSVDEFYDIVMKKVSRYRETENMDL